MAMDLAEKTRRINARWDEINPKHGSRPKKEREALPSLLADDELPERIVVGEPQVADEFAFLPNWLRNVLVVATDRQTLYITTTKTLRLPYADIESASIQAGYGGSVEIVGGAVQMRFTPANRKEAERLIAYVKGEDNSPPGGEPHPRAALIDLQWNAVKPWPDSDELDDTFTRHKRMFYDLIEEGEILESLIYGRAYRAWQYTQRDSPNYGVVVATNKRVLFVGIGVLGGSDVSEMHYRNMGAVGYSTGLRMADVEITGRGVESFLIKQILPKDSVKPFVDCVRGHLEAAHAPQAVAAPQPASPLSAADEIEKLASLLERGILTQEEFDAKKKQLLGL